MSADSVCLTGSVTSLVEIISEISSVVLSSVFALIDSDVALIICLFGFGFEFELVAITV